MRWARTFAVTMAVAVAAPSVAAQVSETAVREAMLRERCAEDAAPGRCLCFLNVIKGGLTAPDYDIFLRVGTGGGDEDQALATLGRLAGDDQAARDVGERVAKATALAVDVCNPSPRPDAD